MRTQPFRQSELDTKYIESIAWQIIGECKFTTDDLSDHITPKSFSEHLFQKVLQKVMRMHPRTMGHILSYGLKPGERCGLRVMSMSEGWFGTVENTESGLDHLSWATTAVVVAAIYDLLSLQFVADCITRGMEIEENLLDRHQRRNSSS